MFSSAPNSEAQLELSVKEVNKHENGKVWSADLKRLAAQCEMFCLAAGVSQSSESHKPVMVCSVI